MELYGSLSNISGSVSASYFTGSYIGDGAGLYNLPASGVTGLNLSQIATGSITASVSLSGFNVNTDISVTGSLDVQNNISASVVHLSSAGSQLMIQNTTANTEYHISAGNLGNLNIHENVSNNVFALFNTASIEFRTDLVVTGTTSGSFVGDGSGLYNIPASGVTGTLVSGSSQIEITGTTGYSSFSSSIATTDLSQENRLTSIETKTGSYATTGSNLFIGTQTHSGSILPSVDNAYDLGSAAYQWRDVYISSGSLYIDGTKVIGSTAQELTITTDTGQSIKILEGTTDSIILQTADGDIELKSSADGDILLDPTNGKIMLKGPIEILNGNKIQSSVGGTPVVFANDIVVSGSIDITGTIEGINLTDFSSSLNARLGTLETSTGSLNSFTSSTNSRLSLIETSTSSLNSYTSSNNTRLDTIESTTGSLNSYTSSTNTKLSSIETTTSSIISVNTTQNSRLDSLETTSGSILSTNTAQSSRLDSIESKTGSYATTGSNIFQGNQTITGSLYISQDLIVAGSSSIQNISSSIVNIADNIITVNALNPSVRFGGLAVIDSGSSPQVSGSMLFDSVNNQWLFVHQNQGTVTSSVLLMGPETYDNLGNESYITANRLVKSTGIEHLTNSNISDNGTTVTILSNTVVNGTITATGTTLVSGSSQITFSGLSGLPSGLVSGSSQVSFNSISDKPALVSGSSQISFNSISDKPTLVSGSSQITYGSISGVPSGIVSGSSQVSFNGITDKPTLVSGSSQITYGSISGIPGGIVSGSAQVDLTNTTNYSSGIKTRLNAEGVLSGSAQVVASLPAGTVSGSAQIILSNTTGFGSYLNQAVLTSSTPTFSGAILTNVLRGGIGAATTGGVTNWNDSTNARSGQGHTLLTGNATNGPGPSEYFHPFSFEYSTKDSTGNLTQFAIPYNANQTSMYFRGRYDGTWGSWYTMWNSGNLTNLNQLTNGPGYITSYTETDTLATVTARGSSTSTDVTLNGTLTMGTSGTQYIRMGRFPSSVSNTGEAWIGRASDRSAGTMTVQLGSGSDRTFEVVDNAWSTVIFGASMSAFTYKNNTILHAGNYTSYAMAGAGYSANQNLNTSSTPTFAGANLTDRLYLNGGSYEGSILFGSSTTWRCGIRQHDDADAELRIWTVNNNGMIFLVNGYNGEPADIARPTDGLVVGPGNNVGIGNFSSSDPGYKLQVNGTGYFSGNVRMNANVGVGGDAALKFHVYGSNEFVRFENTSTGGNQYCQLNMRAGNRNSYIWVGNENTSAWAGAGGLNIYTDSGNMDFWTNTVQRVRIQSDGHMVPFANNTYDLGSSSLGWRNVYTNDLHLSNMNKPEGNDVDGTNGNWTIQEGAENLYIINNNNGKKFKIKLEEI